MAKRSDFEPRENDFYPTPFEAVPSLIPYLRGIRTFAEPCAGEGDIDATAFDTSCGDPDDPDMVHYAPFDDRQGRGDRSTAHQNLRTVPQTLPATAIDIAVLLAATGDRHGRTAR